MASRPLLPLAKKNIHTHTTNEADILSGYSYMCDLEEIKTWTTSAWSLFHLPVSFNLDHLS